MGFDREGGKKEKMQRVNLSPFPHSLFIFSLSLHFPTARLPGCKKLCSPIVDDDDNDNIDGPTNSE